MKSFVQRTIWSTQVAKLQQNSLKPACSIRIERGRFSFQQRGDFFKIFKLDISICGLSGSCRIIYTSCVDFLIMNSHKFTFNLTCIPTSIYRFCLPIHLFRQFQKWETERNLPCCTVKELFQLHHSSCDRCLHLYMFSFLEPLSLIVF